MINKKAFILEMALFLVAVLPSLLPAVLGYNIAGIDMLLHLARAFNFDKVLLAGQIPPRWAPDLFYNYGLPAFAAGSSFPYLLVSFFHKLSLSFGQSYVLVEVLAYLFSSLGVYFACKTFFKKKVAALAAAMLWAYSWSHLENLYLGSTFWQVVATIYPGWSLYAIYLSRKFFLKAVLLQSLVSAVLFMSHPPSVVLFIPFVTILFMFIYQVKIKSFLITIAGIILGLGISATITLPTLFERNYLLATRTLGNLFMDCFSYHWRLPSWSNADISWTVYIIVVLTLVWTIKRSKLSKLTRFSFLLFILAIFFNWEGSALVWQKIPFFRYILYPFRFFALAELAAALMVGELLENLNVSGKVSGLFVGIIIIFSLIIFWSPQKISNDWQKVNSWDLANYRGSASTMDEIIPMGISNDVKYGALPFRPEIISGDGEITEVTQTPRTKLVKVLTRTPSVVSIGTLYYPGWQTLVDDKEVFPNTSFITTDNKDYTGLITQPVGIGEHKVLIRFQETPLRNLANLISAASFSLWVFVLLILGRKLIIRG